MKALYYLILLSIASSPLFSQQEITELEHWINNSTLVPNFEGETFQIYLKEKLATAIANDPDHDYNDKVVLMIHGFSMPSSPVFDFQSDQLSWMEYLANEGFDVFSLDLTGYGHSTRPTPMQDSCNLSILDQLQIDVSCSPNYPFLLTNTESELDDIDAAIAFIQEWRGVDSISLIGHSAGAGRALLYAASRPDRVDKLILHGFGTLFGYLPPGPPDNLPSSGNPMAIFDRDRFQDWADDAVCYDQLDTSLVDPIWEQTQWTDSLGPAWLEGYVRHPLFESWGLTLDTVESIQVPTLLLAGEHDPLAPPLSVFILYNDLQTTNKVQLTLNRTSHNFYWENRKTTAYQFCVEWLETSQIDNHTTGVAISKLNNTLDWVFEFDELEPPHVKALFPEDDAVAVELETNLILELDENIENLDTFSFITLFKKSDLSVVEFISVGDTSRVKQVCTNRLEISIDPLEMDTEYFVYVEDEAFTDRSQNFFEGILDDKKWNFSTALPVSTKQVLEPFLQVYPNPSEGIIQIENPKGPSLIHLFNNSGQKVYSTQLFQQSIQLNLQHLPAGFYTLQIIQNNQTQTLRIVFQ